MKTKIGFSIYLNGKLVREVTFDRPIVNVGKLSTSNLRIDDINVSRKHAVIEQRENGEWRITDLGSTNGTILAGKRIVQADLKDGDRLVLGTTTLIVHLDASAVQKVAEREEPKIEDVTSGVAGDRPKKKAPPPVPSVPRPVEEIRGLGSESFYKKKEAGDADSDGFALEVALLWGETVLAVESFDKPEVISIGEAKGCRFTVPQEVLGGKRFDLVVPSNGRFAVDISNPNIEGDLLVGGAVKSLAELRGGQKQFPITEPVRGRLRVGPFTLLLTYGPKPTRAGIRGLAQPDYDAWIYIAVSAIVHIAFLIVLYYLPEDMMMSQRDPRQAKERALQVLRVDPKEEEEELKKKEEEQKELEKKKVGESETPGTLEDLRDVQVENPSEVPVETPSPNRTELVNKLDRKKQERESFEQMSPEERKERAKQLAQQTALNQQLADENPLFNQLLATNPDLNQNQLKIRALTSRSDPSSPSDSFAEGSLDPFGGTLSPGSGGFQAADGGLSPGGPGGPGGPAVGGLRNPGRDGRNIGDIGLQDRTPEPKIQQLPVRLVGELDAKTVQQYIRRYLSGIKWCYQDRLQQNRKLQGKLTLAFTILPNGGVHDARTTNSTLGDAELEACIAKKMSRWKFPTPKDGGLVEVAYPLILKTQ
ncbi:MAG: AgmX/PglI C-terminal domain-containing protein [Myxococcales bacterium]|nr:AgmX/PglI C-terminal domain-containing protein [Myxococcales bacterium]MCB9733038.1 AgmX/PglI C-terminal domain-containing protein [Deltaproteobacteria bacterium]